MINLKKGTHLRKKEKKIVLFIFGPHTFVIQISPTDAKTFVVPL